MPRALGTRTVLLALFVTSSLLLWSSPAAASSPSSALGVYRGARNIGGVQDFGSWLGRPVNHAVDFIGGDSWSAIEGPTWWTSGWNGSGYQVEFSIPIIPSTGGTLQAGADGDYNSHFVALAHNLVDNGQADATLRLGWEFNGSWYKWSAASDPASFAAYWRQIVDSMRTVPGQHFSFDWCPTLGKASVAPDRAYPGDGYVDYIGADVYDISWIANYGDPIARWSDFVSQPYGLQWQSDFAAAHGKPTTFPEWGLATRSDGHGGGDDPYFIQHMYDWIAGHDVAHADYFEYDAGDGNHSLMDGQFPDAAAKFKELFGPGSDGGAGGGGSTGTGTGSGAGGGDGGGSTGGTGSDGGAGGTGDTGSGSAGTQTVITSPPKHTRRQRRGSVKGRVRGASDGKVAVTLERRAHGAWHRVDVASTRLSQGGGFSKRLDSFGGKSLSRGTYRARARYGGCRAAAPSSSPFHRFQVSRA